MAAPEAELVLAYRMLERQLLRLFQVARTDAGRAFIRGQLRTLRRTVRDLEQAEAEFVDGQVGRQFEASRLDAHDSLARERQRVGRGTFTGFEARGLQALQERVAANLGNVRAALQEGLVLADPGSARATRAVEAALEGDNALVRFQDGRVSVAVPSGRFWRPRVYARMLSRTAIADARRVAFRQRYLSNGIDVVRVVANGTNHDVCRRWEGELLSLTGATPGLPTVDDARASGLFHPNCRHRYVAAPMDELEARGIVEADIAPGRVPEPEAPLPTLGQAARTPRASRAPTTPRTPAR